MSQTNFNHLTAYNETLLDTKVWKLMHRSRKINQSNQKNQTDQLTTETLKRFQSILSGPHAGAFCQTMDTFISGYGKLEINSDVLCVRFLYEEKIKF